MAEIIFVKWPTQILMANLASLMTKIGNGTTINAKTTNGQSQHAFNCAAKMRMVMVLHAFVSSQT